MNKLERLIKELEEYILRLRQQRAELEQERVIH